MRVKAGMIRRPTFYGRSRRYCVSYRSGNSNVNLGQKREVPQLDFQFARNRIAGLFVARDEAAFG